MAVISGGVMYGMVSLAKVTTIFTLSTNQLIQSPTEILAPPPSTPDYNSL